MIVLIIIKSINLCNQIPAPLCKQSSHSSSDPMVSLFKKVLLKLKDGEYKGAVQITCSEDSFTVIDDKVLSALRAKNPSPHPDTCFPNALETPASLTPISEKKVAQAIE